jgi:hypothetical protein
MSNMLLRTMTAKSIIGFGLYPLLTVQELINMNKHSVLIKMYYGLAKIDFDNNVKDLLEIKFERVINKPGKNYDMYYKNIRIMIDEIIDMNRTFHKDNPARWNMLNEKKANKKRHIVTNCIRQNKEKSKIRNRNRNQF